MLYIFGACYMIFDLCYMTFGLCYIYLIMVRAIYIWCALYYDWSVQHLDFGECFLWTPSSSITRRISRDSQMWQMSWNYLGRSMIDSCCHTKIFLTFFIKPKLLSFRYLWPFLYLSLYLYLYLWFVFVSLFVYMYLWFVWVDNGL